MASAKQIAFEIIRSLPDDCSLQDVTDRLYTRQLIEEARDDIRQGRVFTQEQIEQEAAQWLEP
jgi:hypothetical protein